MKFKFSDAVIINPKEKLKKGSILKKISMQDIQENVRNIKNYNEESFSGGSKFRNKDTLFARITPCLENGKIAQVNMLLDEEVAFGSTEFIVFRAKKEITIPDYVYFLSKWDYVREKAIKSMTGTSGRQRVQNDIFNEITIDIPNLNIQKRISVLLNSFDEKIEVNNKIIANLEEQAQAIFKSWFVDFEPFQDGNFVESELGMIPEGWKVSTIKELSKKIITGKTPSTKVKEYYGDKTPFITIPDMHNKIFVIESERHLSKEGEESQKNKTLPPNTVCISCIATVGLVSLTYGYSQTNQQINSVIPKKDYYLYYIFLNLRNMNKYLEALGSSGSTTKNINKKTFETIKILMPEENILKKFHIFCKKIFELIKNCQVENKKLAEIRDALLPKLMSGEIDVSNIKIKGEEVKNE